MNPLTIYTHPACLEHLTGPGHPERTARLETILALLDEKFADIPRIEAPEARLGWLAYAHSPAHIEAVNNSVPNRGYNFLDSDTVVSSGSWDAAMRAAGAVCRAVEDVLFGKTNRAFCAVRPPGHHAEPD